MSKGITATLLQVKIAYEVISGERFPDDLSFNVALSRMIQNHGVVKMRHVIEAIPNDPKLPDAILGGYAHNAFHHKG